MTRSIVQFATLSLFLLIACPSIGQEVEKGVLVEHFKGAWCAICPEGVDSMNAAIEGLDNVVVVSIHEGDALEIPEALPVLDAYVAGFPMADADRFLLPSEGSVVWPLEHYSPNIEDRLSYDPKVAVYAQSSFDSISRTLKVRVHTEFVDSIIANVGETRLNCYIVEDSVIGPPQANGQNDNPNSPFFNMGDPIIDYPHPNVVRKMMGGSWGLPSIMEDTIVPGDTFSELFTQTLPTNWNENKIFLVAMVQMKRTNPYQREIVNILPLELNDTIMPQEIDSMPEVPNGMTKEKSTNKFDVRYFDDQLQVISKYQVNEAELRITDVSGRIHFHQQSSWSAGETKTFGTKYLLPGIYIAEVRKNDLRISYKFVKLSN